MTIALGGHTIRRDIVVSTVELLLYEHIIGLCFFHLGFTCCLNVHIELLICITTFCVIAIHILQGGQCGPLVKAHSMDAASLGSIPCEVITILMS